MKRVYTAAHVRFLSKRIRGTSRAEITRLFNEHFGLSATEAAVKNLLQKNGLANGLTGPGRKFTARHIEFIRDNVAGRGNAELAELFNKKFGLPVNENTIQNLKHRYGLFSGVNLGRFPKGLVPHNKGRKGYCYEGSEKGWFKPGHPGYKFNERPVGSERVNSYGYVEIKIADKKCKEAKERNKNWKAKHIVIWEKANGPVPKGHIVIFLDGDKSHIVLKNLMMVSRKAHAVMCHMNWYTNDREVTKANCLMAEIKTTASNLKRKSFRVVKNKKMIFLNNKGHKVFVIRDKNRWIPARETSAGNLVRLRVKELRSKASRGEAQRELYEYAAYRGWMRI